MIDFEHFPQIKNPEKIIPLLEQLSRRLLNFSSVYSEHLMSVLGENAKNHPIGQNRSLCATSMETISKYEQGLFDDMIKIPQSNRELTQLKTTVLQLITSAQRDLDDNKNKSTTSLSPLSSKVTSDINSVERSKTLEDSVKSFLSQLKRKEFIGAQTFCSSLIDEIKKLQSQYKASRDKISATIKMNESIQGAKNPLDEATIEKAAVMKYLDDTTQDLPKEKERIDSMLVKIDTWITTITKRQIYVAIERADENLRPQITDGYRKEIDVANARKYFGAATVTMEKLLKRDMNLRIREAEGDEEVIRKLEMEKIALTADLQWCTDRIQKGILECDARDFRQQVQSQTTKGKVTIDDQLTTCDKIRNNLYTVRCMLHDNDLCLSETEISTENERMISKIVDVDDFIKRIKDTAAKRLNPEDLKHRNSWDKEINPDDATK